MNSLSKLLGSIFIASSFMPWIGIYGLDSQPFPAIFSTLFLSVNYKKLPTILIDYKTLLMLIFAIFGLLFGTLFNFNFEFDFILFRGIYHYLGFIILMMGYLLYFQLYKFPLKFLMIVNIIWIVIGVIQIFYPEVLSGLIDSRSGTGRGVASLAPEPSFFGIFLFFITWIYLIKLDYQFNLVVKFFIAINFLSVIFLAQSSLIILYTFFALFLTLLFKPNLRIFFAVSIVIFLLIMLKDRLGSSRIEYFVAQYIYDPLNFFSTDQSANQRLSYVILPIHGLIHNYFLPGGLHNYQTVIEEIIPIYEGYFFYSFNDTKISSWLGTILFELGFFGLLIFSILLFKSFDQSKKRAFEILLLLVLLLSSIPFAFPLIPFIISIFIYKNNITNKSKL